MVERLYKENKDYAKRFKEGSKLFWRHLDEELERYGKKMIEAALNIKIEEEIQARYYESAASRKNWRNGYYYRDLITNKFNFKGIKIPRLRRGGYEFVIIDKFKRKTEEFEKLVYRGFILGLSSEGTRRYFEEFFGEGIISEQGVSNIFKELTKESQDWHNRTLQDEYEYLYLDGQNNRIRESVKRQKVMLYALGVKNDGRKEILEFQLATSESTDNWLKVLQNLYRRGLEGKNLKLIISDDSEGIKEALSFVYPHIKHQICCVHRLRNLSKRLKNRQIRKAMMKEAKEIYKQENKQKAIKKIKRFESRWKVCEPNAVKSFIKGIDATLRFYDFPKQHWKKLKTNNPLERILREFNRRIRPMNCFRNDMSCERVAYALVIEFNEQQKRLPVTIQPWFLFKTSKFNFTHST